MLKFFGAKVSLAFLLTFSLALTGCNTNNERAGQVIGGIAGGVLGSRFGEGSGKIAAVVAGTLLGAYLGGELGAQMDENDRYRTQHALETNRTNQGSSWQNPDSGYSYTVTPTSTYETASGPCREYVTQAYIDGKAEEVRGTACRDAEGNWRASDG